MIKICSPRCFLPVYSQGIAAKPYLSKITIISALYNLTSRFRSFSANFAVYWNDMLVSSLFVVVHTWRLLTKSRIQLQDEVLLDLSLSVTLNVQVFMITIDTFVKSSERVIDFKQYHTIGCHTLFFWLDVGKMANNSFSIFWNITLPVMRVNVWMSLTVVLKRAEFFTKLFLFKLSLAN